MTEERKGKMRMLKPKVIMLTILSSVFGGCADLDLNHDRVPTDLEIRPRGRQITDKEVVQLEVVVFDQNGQEMQTPSWTPVVWRVTADSVVEVNGNGLLSPVHGGETVVQATMAGLGDAVRFRVNPSTVVLSAPVIYLNQAAQNQNGSVALIPGRPALIRVFMIGDQTSYYGPGVRVSFFQEDTEVFSQVFAQTSERTPNKVIESSMDGSVNGIIPGSVIQHGVSMVVELDPDGLVPLGTSSRTRYPAIGSLPLDVANPPLFRQIIVPTISTHSPNDYVYNWTDGLNPDHPRVRMIRTLLPVSDMELEVRETYRTSADLNTGNGWYHWIDEMGILYRQEGQRGYYYGVATPPSPAFGGLGLLGYPVAVGLPGEGVYVHEVGHTMSLWHAPCGGAGFLDPGYPHRGGVIGIWGFNVRLGRLVDIDHKDVMSYCGPWWISDYHFTRATHHRMNGDGGVVLDEDHGAQDRGQMLVVWGSVRDGGMTLEPAFIVNGPPAFPETDGPYRVDALGADGQTEFSLSFSPTPMEYGGGSFVFFVPWEADWADSLDRMVLTGPEGEYTLTRSGAPAMAVVTDPITGRIQAIIRNWKGEPLPGEGTAGVSVTRGIARP